MAEEAMRAVEAIRPRRLDLPLLGRRLMGHRFACLTLDVPPDWLSLPGQFINILCESDAAALAASEGRDLETEEGEWPRTTGLEIARARPVVRRPYSVSRLRRQEGRARMEILVRAVGCGSKWLHARPLGATVNVVGPLGNPFTAPADDRLCLLVGGGCGVAPIFGLADYLAAQGKRCLGFFGATTADDMPVTYRSPPPATGAGVEPTDLVDEFAEDGIQTVLATEDGSAGFRGLVTEALKTYLRDVWKGEPLALYGCGPTPMLKALAEVAAERRLPCQISLERFMGCGVGLCLSCVMKRRDAASEKGWTFRLTCREGPVVDATEVLFD